MFSRVKVRVTQIMMLPQNPREKVLQQNELQKM